MAKARIRLDETDHKILSLLTQDAGLQNKELAKRIGLAPSTCLARVRKLERSGHIVGYRAIVARSGHGARLEGWADIRFSNPTAEITGDFLRLLRATPEVIEAHRVAGQFDYVVRFSAGDLTAWTKFREQLDHWGETAHARFSVLVEPLK